MAAEHSTAPAGPIEQQMPVLSYAPGVWDMQADQINAVCA